MNVYVIHRLLQVIPVLLVVSILTFGLIRLAPGDPAEVALRNQGVMLTKDAIAQMRAQMGLNDPTLVQYARWLSWVDHLSRLLALAGASMPSFWLGLLLIYYFAVVLDWLPAMGRQTPQHLVLPALTLGLGLAPTFARLLRASLLEILGEDYIRTARAKGVFERNVIFRHALRNA
ncbi:MAG: ABC transporter permease, partial [Chloroflexi bacterium]|nr:ABC transporter permease [Chloroflexota bacterium]